MDVTWEICALRSGAVLGELPLDPGGPITRRMAVEQQQTFTLSPLDDACPEDWQSILVRGYSMVVALRDGEPVQAWSVDDWAPGTSVPVNCSSLETCLERTNIPDLEADGLDLSEALARLLTPLVTGFGFTIDWTPCGTPSQEFYDATEDRSLLDAANAIMATPGGPEWRIVVRWADDTMTRFAKVIEIRPKVGERRPDIVLDLAADGGGTLDNATRTGSFAAGKGAVVVIGVSDGSGAARPMTQPLISHLANEGWPLWEERVPFVLDPDSPLDEDTLLAGKAQKAAAQREKGATAWTLALRPGIYLPGVDFAEGDTLPVDVAPQGKTDPTGGSGDVRVVGWTEDLRSGAVTLILLDDDGTVT